MHTVLEQNSILGTSHYRGEFDDANKAIDYAERQANRSRKFVTFQVWTGTAKRPGKFTGVEYKGVK